MNDKAHVCDCPADMSTQQCIRYCTGECNGPSDTPTDGTPSEPRARLSDGVPSTLSTITVYGNWGTLTWDAIMGNVLHYDFRDSDSECNTDGYTVVIGARPSGNIVAYCTTLEAALKIAHDLSETVIIEEPT